MIFCLENQIRRVAYFRVMRGRAEITEVLGKKEGIVFVSVSPRPRGLFRSVLPYSTTTALVLWSILAMSPLKKESPGRSSLQVPRLTKSPVV